MYKRQGVYYTNESAKETVERIAEIERGRSEKFFVEIGPLKNYYPAEELSLIHIFLNQSVGKSLRTHNLKPKKGAQAMRKNEKITALYERLSRDDFGKDDDQQRESNSISNCLLYTSRCV